MRVLQPQALVIGEHFYRPDPKLGWTNQPGYRGRMTNGVDYDSTIRIDSLGLRGGEPTGQRPAVLGIGDSFMFGFGVDEDQSFFVRAAHAAGAQPLNAGVPGYDLCQAVDLAAELLPRLQADAIVIAPCLANDELDVAAGRDRMEVQHGYFVEPGVTFEPNNWKRRLFHPIFAHSQLVRFLRYSPLTAWFEKQLYGEDSIGRRSLRAMLAAYEDPAPPEVLRGDELTGQCFDRLRDLAAARHLPVIGVLIPDELEVRPEKLAPTEHASGEEGGRFDLGGPRRRMTRLLREAGFQVVDPTAALRAAVARGEVPWFTRDRHFTVAGSAVVARTLEPALARTLADEPRPSPPIR